MAGIEFQKIHSDLVVETQRKQFISADERSKIATSLQSENNLSDLSDKNEALKNLGISADTLVALANISVQNEKLQVINGEIQFSKTPLSGQIILNIAIIVDANNVIISEDYNNLSIQGKIGHFIEQDPEYENNFCLVSYMTMD